MEVVSFSGLTDTGFCGRHHDSVAGRAGVRFMGPRSTESSAEETAGRHCREAHTRVLWRDGHTIGTSRVKLKLESKERAKIHDYFMQVKGCKQKSSGM